MKKKFIPPPEKIHVLSEEDLDLEPKRILLLEDDKDLAPMLECFLETNSFQVTTVSNGVQGLRKIMESDFDVILCDLVMPNLPGDMFYLAVERTKPRLLQTVSLHDRACRRSQMGFIYTKSGRGDASGSLSNSTNSWSGSLQS